MSKKSRRSHESISGWEDMNPGRDTGNKQKAKGRRQSLSGWSAWVERSEGRGMVATEQHTSWMIGHTVWAVKEQKKFQVQEIRADIAVGTLEDGTQSTIKISDLRELDIDQNLHVGKMVLAPFEETCSACIGLMHQNSAVVVFDDYQDEGAFELPLHELVALNEPPPFQEGMTIGAPYPIYYEAIVFRILGDRCSVVFVGWEDEGEFWMQTKEILEAPPTGHSETIDEMMPLATEEEKKDYLANELSMMKERCANLLDMIGEVLVDNEIIRKEKCQLALTTSLELTRLNELIKAAKMEQ